MYPRRYNMRTAKPIACEEMRLAACAPVKGRQPARAASLVFSGCSTRGQ